MATNPKLPDYPDIPPRRIANDHAKVHMIRQSKFPWPLLALIAGAALLIAIIAVLPRGPHVTKAPAGAEIPKQTTAEQIQLMSVQTVPSTVGGALYLGAMLHNTGNTAITGAEVNAQFLGRTGETLGAANGTVQAASGAVGQDLTQVPIKPDETRPVRIYFEHTPKGWNHQVPVLTVTTVTGTTP
jgi:hypothetical protein